MSNPCGGGTQVGVTTAISFPENLSPKNKTLGDSSMEAFEN